METEIIEHGIGKECKENMVSELAKEFASDKNLIITSYFGLKADDLNNLRRDLKKVSSRYLVVKNSIAQRALKKANLTEMVESISGGVGVAFGGKDYATTIKALAAFAKAHEQLKIQMGFLGGEILSKEKIKHISILPSKEALLARLVGTMNASISSFVTVLAATLRSFIYVIQAYKEKVEKNQVFNEGGRENGREKRTI